MVEDFPELGEYARFYRAPENTFKFGTNQRVWDSVFHADPSVFDIFTHVVVEREGGEIFNSPNDIAISESMSRYYFGEQSAVGQTIQSPTTQYRVVLVYEDLPENTHLRYDALLPLSALDSISPDFQQQPPASVWSASFYTYFMVNPGFDESTFPSIADRFYRNRMEPLQSAYIEGFTMDLQPLTDAHFGESFMNDAPVGNIFYVYGFSIVAIFLLVVSGLNYISITVAQLITRQRELAVKSVLGASRNSLGWQLVIESTMLSVLAAIVGYLIAATFIKTSYFSETLQKSELTEIILQYSSFVQILVIGLIFGVVTGLYPYFKSASLSIKAGLTSSKALDTKRFSIGQILVLIQLAITVAIASCASLMAAQVDYLKTKPLGFEVNDRIAIRLKGADVLQQIPLIKEQLLSELPIRHISAAENLPGSGSAISIQKVEGRTGATENVNVAYLSVDSDYLETMNIPLLAGDGFARNVTGGRHVVVNESLVRRMGWNDPIGKRVGTGVVIPPFCE
ncbi:MAG TPA: hypothetical protein DEG76_04645, partial [Pseudohongiella sp.]|nr:hypothetical protein [Pseudohongiella sp.]